MTSRKLSESDKQQILQLYRQPGETTSTLASRYGVSNSTISRILKTSFSEAEYETLIQQKRGSRSVLETAEAVPVAEVLAEDSNELPALESDSAISDLAIEDTSRQLALEVSVSVPVDSEVALPVLSDGRRLRKRSSAPAEPDRPVAPPILQANSLELVDLAPTAALAIEVVSDVETTAKAYDDPEANTVEEMLGEDLLEREAELAVDDDLDDDDDDLDDLNDDDDLDDDLDDNLENGSLLTGGRIAGKALVQVLPLADASLPRTCYLVVDRSAELIARPLKEFGDLGQIPEAEILEKTLPVFDNHRVAKRYSNPRTQRVIKLPDGQVLQKASSHLQAKGITRLLIDGQVYAL